MRDDSEVIPHQSVTVEHEHKPVLYLPDGRALVRPAGFRAVPLGEGASGGMKPVPPAALKTK